jgi:hypothetical protein
MAHTHRTAHKSTDRPPIGHLAPRSVPLPQESQPFVIELVVPESPMTQGSHAEEQQEPKNHGVKDKADEEQSPLSDTENEKMYQDADEVESFGAEAPVPADRLWALLEHLGITTAPRYWIKEVPRPGGWSSRPSQRYFSGPESSASTRGQLSECLAATLWLMPPGKPSLHGSIATRVDCRTPSTASYLTRRRINSRPMR